VIENEPRGLAPPECLPARLSGRTHFRAREITFLSDGGNPDGIRSPVFRDRGPAKIVTGSEGGFSEPKSFFGSNRD
jgi:hypothetical protein